MPSITAGYGARVRGAHVLAIMLAAAAVLAGCAEQVDTAKQTFPRSTIPAAQGKDTSTRGGEPKTNDAAFTPEKLRRLDPCGLLTEDFLAAVGEPAENRPQDFGECANYMEDKDGKELSITLYVGDQANGDDAEDNIGGLPAVESQLDDGGACFVTVITSTDPAVGIKLQVSGDNKDLCGIGRTLMTSVVDLIRSDPPQLDIPAGSMVEVDPCAVLDAATVKTLLGVEATSSPYNLHWCNWTGDGVNLGMWFRTGYDPKESSDAGQPIDLGSGITGYQTATVSGGVSCRLEWLHLATGKDDAAEVVTLNLDKVQAPEGDNGCPAAIEVAKKLITALPKA